MVDRKEREMDRWEEKEREREREKDNKKRSAM